LFLGGLGVTELARRVGREIQQDDCLGRAAQLAYYFLFALFPFFLVLITLLGYLPIPNLLDRLMDMLAQMLPGDALSLVQDHVRELVTGERGGLLSFGLLAALWTSSSAVTAIMEGLNRAYDVDEGRPFWKVRGLAILLTIGLSIFIIVSLVLLTFGPLPHPTELVEPAAHRFGGDRDPALGLQRQGQRGTTPTRATPAIGMRGCFKQRQQRPLQRGRQHRGAHRRSQPALRIGFQP
jgi:hypothetical protein